MTVKQFDRELARIEIAPQLSLCNDDLDDLRELVATHGVDSFEPDDFSKTSVAGALVQLEAPQYKVNNFFVFFIYYFFFE